jgi:hypothetical protein
MAMTTKGAVRIALIQNLRIMSRNSGFSSSALVVMVRGSSAMPQIGQNPGAVRTICGCMGQVYSVRVGLEGNFGSNVMPQLGHGPGFGSRTSGHMGQTYAFEGEGAMGTGEDLGAPSVTSPSDFGFRYCSGSASNF